MASFTVTTSATTIPLQEVPKEGGPSSFVAQASFTITNTTDVVVNGQATVVPQGSTPKDALSIAGASSWDVPPKGTVQLTVNVAVQPTSTDATYAFTVVAKNSNSPDEDFAESQVVTCTKPGVAPAKKIPYVLIGIIAAVVLIGGLVTFKLLSGGNDNPSPTPSSTGNPTGQVTTLPTILVTGKGGFLNKFSFPPLGTVPPVVGIGAAQATQILQAAGYQVSSVQATSFGSVDTVVKQVPDGLVKAFKGATVTITLAFPANKVVDDEKITLSDGDKVDLDSGSVSSSGSDVEYDCCFKLAPLGDAAATKVGSQSPASCMAADKSGSKVTLGSDSIVCFSTSQGRVSIVRVTGIAFLSVVVRVTTWDAPQFP
jgi:hypothetical protein